MIRLSANRFMTPNLPLRTLVQRMGELGLDGIGLTLTDISHHGTQETTKILRDSDLTATSLGGCLGAIALDASGRASVTPTLQHGLDVAAELGVPLVVTVGGPSEATPLHAWRSARSSVVATLSEAATIAGVDVLVEPLAPSDVAFSALIGLDGADEVMAAPRLEVLLDTWHAWWDERFYPFVAQHADALSLIHLADHRSNVRVLPGAGDADLPALVDALLAGGFHGWWEVEVLADAHLAEQEELRMLDEAVKATRSLLAQAAHA